MQSYSPLVTLYERGRAIRNHPDPDISSRMPPIGAVGIKCQATLVMASDGSDFVACHWHKKSIACFTPTLVDSGRSGSNPPPHFMFDKLAYMVGESDDSTRHKMYVGGINEFRGMYKGVPNVLEQYFDLITDITTKREKIITMIAAASAKTALIDAVNAMVSGAKITESMQKQIDALWKFNINVVCEDSTSVWDWTNQELVSMWNGYYQTVAGANRGKPRTNFCTGELETPATKMSPLTSGTNSGIIVPLGTCVDPIDINLGHEFCTIAMASAQDALNNNSRIISPTNSKNKIAKIAMIAISNSTSPKSDSSEHMLLDTVEYFAPDQDLEDMMDAVNGTSSRDEIDPMTLETSLKSPLLAAIDLYKEKFPNLAGMQGGYLTIMFMHIPSNGQTSIIGFDVTSDIHDKIVSYADDTCADVIMYVKLGEKYIRVIGRRTPSISELCAACSTHTKRTSGNADVRKNSRRVYSYAQMVSLVESITKGKPIPVWVIRKAASNVLRDLSIYGACGDIVTQLSTIDAMYNNISRRNQMERDMLITTSENIGRIMAIAVDVSRNPIVIGNDRHIFDAITRMIVKPRENIVPFITQKLYNVYLTKLSRKYGGLAKVYRDEIDSLMSVINRDELDTPLDEVSFAIGFHRKMVEIEQKRLARLAQKRDEKQPDQN